jgi:hypothetical protein
MREPSIRPRAAVAAVLLASSLAVASCSGSGPADLLSTAQLEEVQDNPEHARELYAEIVRRYPDSAESAKARERLAALDAKQGRSAQGADAGSRTQ